MHPCQKKYKGLAILLEHRFYCASLPVHENTTAVGIRAALLCIRNSSTIFASWASAPVQAQVDQGKQKRVELLRRLDSSHSIYRGDNERKNGIAIVEMKFNLIKERLSGPEGNTTCANNLTSTVANKRAM
ncbi:hypothetical protein BYT27DRAFT_7203057 [Phlegmacium glaucopus]|nr:hypothetical protein BYT27DRAFT_7203057 [Phlegmacium glaucopus]